jgi:hypothetical protein
MLGVAREPVDLGAGRGPRPDPVWAEPRARQVGTQPAQNPQHERGRLPAELVALGFLGDRSSVTTLGSRQARGRASWLPHRRRVE